jgi:hypothetical protein
LTLSEDGIGGLRPQEELRFAVGVLDEEQDRVLKRASTSTGAALEFRAGSFVESALRHSDKRRAGRREVFLKPRMLGQPTTNNGSLVGTVVVENGVFREFRDLPVTT